MQRVLGGLALPILILLAAGCRTVPRVDSQAKPGTDFAKYHTFCVLPLESSPISDPGMALRLSDVAVQAVKDGLWANGLEIKPREEADLAVAMRGQSVPKVQVTDWGYLPVYYSGQGYYHGAYRDIDVRTYEERTLVLEIYDNHSKEMVWAGWATAPGSGKVKAEDFQEAIRRILVRFPPRQPEP
jgi:hypothetical protein